MSAIKAIGVFPVSKIKGIVCFTEDAHSNGVGVD
jgi:hypothetical protein